MTLREALAEILTPPVLARLVGEQLETEYIVAEALLRIRRDRTTHTPAARAIVAWCRTHASVWLLEDGDRRLEAPSSPAPRI